MTARSVVDTVVAAIPGRRALLAAAGRLPPALRSPWSFRLLSALARRTPLDTPDVVTNLGMARGLRCRMPAAHLVPWLGLPSLYRGERGALALVACLAARSDLFFDIGAHLGYFTFFVRARNPSGPPIHFFEPDPALFARLDGNVRDNAMRDVVGHLQAIGDRDGTATFLANLTDSSSGSLTAMFAEQHRVVPTEIGVTAFATVAARVPFARACVKVDVEGYEWPFMDGAAGTFDRIGYLVMEVLGPAHARGFVRAMMTRGGFRAYYVNDYTLEPSADGTFTYRAPEYNWLFCREAPDELARTVVGTPLRVRAARR